MVLVNRSQTQCTVNKCGYGFGLKKPGQSSPWKYIQRKAIVPIQGIFTAYSMLGFVTFYCYLVPQGKKMTDRNIWWLAFFDDQLTFILLSQEKFGHLFFGSLLRIPTGPSFQFGLKRSAQQNCDITIRGDPANCVMFHGCKT